MSVVCSAAGPAVDDASINDSTKSFFCNKTWVKVKVHTLDIVQEETKTKT